jgi:type I restriction enzyme M protein
MTNASGQIVQKLWRYCNILRDDGLSFPAYVEQLTYLLFLKMAYENLSKSPGSKPIIPREYDWNSLVSKKDNSELHSHYAATLKALSVGKGMLGTIFHEANNKIRDPAKLRLLVVDLIDKENWSSLDADVKGDAYEGLLEKNAQDTKSGAGQYFTPRPLIRAIVDCVRPKLGETIYDPACGTCGFLLVAHDYIRSNFAPKTLKQLEHLRLKAFHGVELVHEVTRLGAMNLLLHGIGPSSSEEGPLPITTDDALLRHPNVCYDLILTNPPFGRKSSVAMIREFEQRENQPVTAVRSDFFVNTSNKQLNFVQHVYTTLNKNGRAAIVIPDNVLFEGGGGEIVRRRLLEACDVHTLLRLPAGLFYAHGIKTNVLFFDRNGKSKNRSNSKLWVYDLRNSMHFSLRSNPLEESDLTDFVQCYHPENRALRSETWSPQTPKGRWRAYSYDELSKRNQFNLDLVWLNAQSEELDRNDAADLAQEIMADLQKAISQIHEIATSLNRHK